MPVPALDDLGLLPGGIHDSDLAEISRRFGRGNLRRERIMRGLTAFLRLARQSEVLPAVYVDGSFTTGKDRPGDVDVALPLPDPALFRHIPPLILSRGALKREYDVDCLAFVPGVDPDFIDFFQQLRPEERSALGIDDPNFRKGIVRLTLPVPRLEGQAVTLLITDPDHPAEMETLPPTRLGDGQPPRFESWVELAQYKAKVLEQQIYALRDYARATGVEDYETLFQELSAPMRERLRTIYAEELPLAEAEGASDLFLHYTGPAVDEHAPTLGLLTKIFNDVRTQVKKVARAVVGAADGGRTDMDLTLSAYARGSLYVGFSVPDPETLLFGEEDPLYDATREALRALGVVSRVLTEDGGEAQLLEEIPDPAVRDAALQAVKQLAPTVQSGITGIGVSGNAAGNRTTKPLTNEDRREASRILEVGTAALQRRLPTTLTLTGTVREIDLDDRRFYLRRIDELNGGNVRCAYTEEVERLAEGWLNQTIRVTGLAEYGADEQPRLIHVQTVDIVQ